jgi:ABC-type phosphate/phosphonate transport system substrate-binding protein
LRHRLPPTTGCSTGRRSHPCGLRPWTLAALAAVALTPVVARAERDVRIGVLAFRPKPEEAARWQPTADYLSARLPGLRFQVVPLGYADMDRALPEAAVDFVITNPSHYILMSQRHGLSRVATLVERSGHDDLSFFGGVVVVRADRYDLRELGDLAHKTIAAPDSKSLGGYQVQAAALREAGVELPSGARLVFTDMPHDRAVEAVLASKADAGFVRTGVLETMIEEGKLDASAVRVLNEQHPPRFALRVSTRLYPEWPFAVMPHVDQATARQVTVALLSMSPESEAATMGRYRGWTIPADYEPVRLLLAALRLPPYDGPAEFSVADELRKHRYSAIAALVFVLLLVAATLRLRHLNDLLAREVRAHEQLIAELREAMANVKLLSGLLPICASCKKIRDDRGYWQQLEGYLQDHTGAEFSHGMCPDCARRWYGKEGDDAPPTGDGELPEG